MTRQELEQALAPKLRKWAVRDAAGNITGEDHHIVLETDVSCSGDCIQVSVVDFLALFGGVNLTHADLKSVDPSDSMGYHKYFDEWKSKGHIQ